MYSLLSSVVMVAVCKQSPIVLALLGILGMGPAFQDTIPSKYGHGRDIIFPRGTTGPSGTKDRNLGTGPLYIIWT